MQEDKKRSEKSSKATRSTVANSSVAIGQSRSSHRRAKPADWTPAANTGISVDSKIPPLMTNDEPASIEYQIGQKIRALRLERNVTLDQLANEVKLTKGQVSKIENGKVSSPVSTLTRIAVALAVEPGYFFQSTTGTQPRASLVRKEERKVIVGRGTKLGHSYELLAYGLPFQKDFEPYLMRIEEKDIDPEKNVFRHPGHVLLFMIKGKMDYRHGGQVYHLEPGDSLFFDGNTEHGPARVYLPPVEFLSIISNIRS
jgi:transcriptional regulator with XRE-family HTH domain